MYLLNFILLTCSAKFNSLNYYFLLNFLIFSQFLRAASAQSSCFNLLMFKELLLIKLYLTSYSIVDLLL